MLLKDKTDWRDKNYGVKSRPFGEVNRTKQFGTKSFTGGGGSQESKISEELKSEKNTGGGRRLSQAKLEESSKKGLCFKCGEK